MFTLDFPQTNKKRIYMWRSANIQTLYTTRKYKSKLISPAQALIFSLFTFNKKQKQRKSIKNCQNTKTRKLIKLRLLHNLAQTFIYTFINCQQNLTTK